MIKYIRIIKVVFATITFLITFSNTVFSQNKFFNGYIITNNGDSLYGQLRYKEWKFNPKSIEANLNNENKVFGTADIKGFEIPGYAQYKSALVTYQLNLYSGVDLPDKFSDSTITSQVFLKRIVAGHYSLYELTLKERAYYFISEDDKFFSELIFRAKLVNNTVVEDFGYKEMLKSYFLKEGMFDKYEMEINTVSYNSQNLGRLISKLNKQNSYFDKSTKKEKNFQVDVLAGFILSSYPSHFAGGLYNNSHTFQLNKSISPTAGVALRYALPFGFKAVSLGLSLQYNNYTTTGSGKYIDSTVLVPVFYYSVSTYNAQFSLKHSEAMVNLYAMAFINRFDKVRCFVRAGGSLFISSLKTGVIENSTLDVVSVINSSPPTSTTRSVQGELFSINKTLIQPQFGIGVEAGRHRLEFNYSLPIDFRNRTTATDPKFEISSIGLIYSYNIFK